jgi:hypothetical protein
MRRSCVLALCFAFAACATPAGRQTAAPPPAERGPSDLLSAVGSYFDPADGRGHLVVLHEHQGTWWLLADDHLLSVRPERRGSGFALRPPIAETAEESLPREFVFQPGSPDAPRWRYQAGAWTGQQFLDPVANRVVRRGQSVRLTALGEGEPRSPHVLEISDGWLMRLDRPDETSRERCQAGWAFPDPTGNSARELHPARAAQPGGVSRLFYSFFNMPDASGEDGNCQFRPVPGHTYKYRSGFRFYLFVDADNRIVGAQLVGYMYVESFVVPGIPDALRRSMLEANREETGRQAE